ncbi:MAG: hypothetical protein RLZZ373_3224 [Pseudomonadota bacterium]|jgi:hypothetical protein
MTWECLDGLPDEDHDWSLLAGDESTGEGDSMVCRQCGKTREATHDETRDSYTAPEWG